jgi:DNA-directed RNA polymerase specialized sigma24 family protein
MDVLAWAAAGDEVAFRRIIAAHHGDMRRVCAYIAGDLNLAEEATQAAWAIA